MLKKIMAGEEKDFKEILQAENGNQFTIKVRPADNAGEKSAKSMVCLDWDNTVVKGHMHSKCNRAGIDDSNVSIERIKDVMGAQNDDITTILRNPEQIKETIQNAQKNGIAVAIVSHSSYNNAIEATLNEWLGNKTAKNITISTCALVNNKKIDKSLMIDEIRKEHGIGDKHKGNVVLVDDDKNNIDQVEKAGYKGIHAPTERELKKTGKEGEKDNYLDQLTNFVGDIEKEQQATREHGDDIPQKKQATPNHDGGARTEGYDDRNQNNQEPEPISLSDILKAIVNKVCSIVGLEPIFTTSDKTSQVSQSGPQQSPTQSNGQQAAQGRSQNPNNGRALPDVPSKEDNRGKSSIGNLQSNSAFDTGFSGQKAQPSTVPNDKSIFNTGTPPPPKESNVKEEPIYQNQLDLQATTPPSKDLPAPPVPEHSSSLSSAVEGLQGAKHNGNNNVTAPGSTPGQAQQGQQSRGG